MITDTGRILAALRVGKVVMVRPKGGDTWTRLKAPPIDHEAFEYWIGANCPKTPSPEKRKPT